MTRTLEDFVFVRFDGTVSKPTYPTDKYFNPPKKLKELVIANSMHMKPVCVIVTKEMFLQVIQLSSVTVERNELGVFVSSYALPFSDTRITCEEYLTDYKPDDEVRDNIESIMRPFIGCD